ncbi:TonB family protein [Gaoshiqia sediminis]|uniref:M56 family metallopeptidase n=1 Tax=Gaoshiqia sediminis TaxID=2986998 RepID=A0AA42C653_9BACT|nr:TonB family protein [Gaoshiqia sediminis]MCW0483543.1 M56 family metallopeptidase [Gaoshiqia sediminis]
MNSFIHYILESGISLGAFSLIYFLFLRQETFFTANRLFLLFAVVFSSLLPLLHLRVYEPDNLVGVPTSDTVNMLEAITITGSGFSGSLAGWISASYLLVVGYLGISVLVALFVLLRIGQLVVIIRKAQVLPKSGVNYVYINDNSSPYSFLNYLFVSRNMENNPAWDKMLVHESEHIRQGHTVDILVLELISIVQWFNPFFWLLRRVIKENHEYMADRAVLNKGVAINQYKEILVTQFIGSQFSIANNFNSSLIKSRLNMMTKIKSSNMSKFRYFIGGAMAAALLLAFACESKDNTIVDSELMNNGVQIRSASSEQPLILIDGEMADREAMAKLDPNGIQSVNVMKESSESLVQKYGELVKNGVIEITLKAGATDVAKETQALLAQDGDVVFNIVEEMPDFPGGEVAFRQYIANHISYPDEAKMKGIAGKVYVTFVVEKDGSVGRATVVRGVDPLLDAEALKVVKEMPAWTPGKQRGEAVAVSYTIPINFAL